MDKHYVYHIARPGMSVEEGYIGVSVHPKVRLGEHRRGDYRIGRALRKYPDAEMTIIMESSKFRCYATEKMLRPEKNIGWNIAEGGDKPPRPDETTLTKETRKKLRDASRGEKNPHFKGITIGTHIETGEVLRFVGRAELTAAGFHSSAVSKCIAGEPRWEKSSRPSAGGYWTTRKQHKGYTWTREEV